MEHTTKRERAGRVWPLPGIEGVVIVNTILRRALLMGVLGSMAFGQNPTTSELLQKGIYLQETVGDLDGAIKVYRQITQMARESRANAAYAEYRLGICLQKKGQQAEAISTFQRLIQEYPEQTELVAKARQFTESAEHAGGTGSAADHFSAVQPPPISRPGKLKLLAAPWKDGEVLEYKWGGWGGKMWQSFQSSKTEANRWLFEKHTMGSFARLEVDSKTMQPFSTFGATSGNLFRVSYQGHAAQITGSRRKPDSSIALEGPVFDADEIPAILRRLPWKKDYAVTLPVFGSSSGQVVNYEFIVTGEEDVDVLAGRFHCYRVQEDNLTYRNLASEQFWISSDARRLIVKSQALGGATTELSESPRLDPQESIYRDEKTGASFKIPAGWIIGKPPREWESADWFLQDLHSTGFVALKMLDHDAGESTPEGLKAEAEKEAANIEYSTVRPESWQTRQINGHSAVSWIEDRPFYSVVRYRALVGTGTQATAMVAQADPQSFNALRPTFDAIIESLVLK